DACFVGWAKVRTQTLTRHGPQRALPTLYGAQESKAAQMRVCTAWAKAPEAVPFSDVHRGAFADPTTTIGAARRCSSARDLRLEGCDLALAARGEHADLAGAVIGHDHLQRLARLFEDRDVARLGAARGQVEQRPLVGGRIVFGHLVRAPQIGPDVVVVVDGDLVGLIRLRVGQRDQGGFLAVDVDPGERAAERVAGVDEVAVLVGAHTARRLRPGVGRVEVRRLEALIERALRRR